MGYMTWYILVYKCTRSLYEDVLRMGVGSGARSGAISPQVILSAENLNGTCSLQCVTLPSPSFTTASWMSKCHNCTPPITRYLLVSASIQQLLKHSLYLSPIICDYLYYGVCHIYNIFRHKRTYLEALHARGLPGPVRGHCVPLRCTLTCLTSPASPSHQYKPVEIV